MPTAAAPSLSLLIYVNLVYSLSQAASMPMSWPEFSFSNKISDKGKPQSASPPRQSSVIRMKRFQKSTAIYTLPARETNKRRGEYLFSFLSICETKKPGLEENRKKRIMKWKSKKGKCNLLL